MRDVTASLHVPSQYHVRDDLTKMRRKKSQKVNISYVSMRQGEEQRLQCKIRKGLAMDELILVRSPLRSFEYGRSWN